VLENVIQHHFIDARVREGPRELLEVVQHVRFRAAMRVDVDVTGKMVLPTAEIQLHASPPVGILMEVTTQQPAQESRFSGAP
jgi:hypothetical protein